MKICYVNPTFLIRRPIAELINQLGDKNKIGIFVPKKPFSQTDTSWHNNEALKKAKIYSYSAVNLPFTNFEWPIPITPMFFINLFRVFRCYDIIHMWTYFYIDTFFTGIFKLFFSKKQLILTADTFPGYTLNSGHIIDSLFKIYTLLFGWFVFSVPNKIHIYGKSLIKPAMNIGIKKEKISVIPTGIEVDKFRKASALDRKTLGLNKDNLVIFYAGLLVPRKGIDIMLRVTKNLVKKNKNYKLILAGEGPKKNFYQNMAKELGINDNVLFLGWRKDIPQLLKTADLLFLPSRGEGLPGIVMEAMAAGIPVVTTNTGCTYDLIKDGKNGYLCEVNKGKCFEKKILLLKKLNIDNSIIEKLEWNKILNRYRKLYA